MWFARSPRSVSELLHFRQLDSNNDGMVSQFTGPSFGYYKDPSPLSTAPEKVYLELVYLVISVICTKILRFGEQLNLCNKQRKLNIIGTLHVET